MKYLRRWWHWYWGIHEYVPGTGYYDPTDYSDDSWAAIDD